MAYDKKDWKNEGSTRLSGEKVEVQGEEVQKEEEVGLPEKEESIEKE